MDSQVVIALLLASVIGITLGSLGGGGSILAVPILTYVLGMDPREAIAASLFIVGTTSAVSAITYARTGRVRWKTGVLFGTAGMLGAFGGGIIGGFLPGTILMLLFALMMISTAIAMIRSPKNQDGKPAIEPGNVKIWRILIDGLFVGIATGLVGAGGGFLVVPALNLLGGLPIGIAVGTSLLVIALKSFTGLAGYLLSVHLDWQLVLAFTAAAIKGSFIGVFLAGYLPERALRRSFGVFVLAMSAFILVQEIPALYLSITAS